MVMTVLSSVILCPVTTCFAAAYPPHVVKFEFYGRSIDKWVTVWVVGARRSDVKVLWGNLAPPTIGWGKFVVYAVKVPALSVVVRGTRIDYLLHSEVSINGKAMGTELNAVIEPDGSVIMGAFLAEGVK